MMFSGGVGEYVYGREARDFGDMGRRLGQAIRRRVDSGALPWPLLPAGECIRATALGASEYSVQLSGNTSYISKPGELLPRRNLQVLQPSYVCEEVIEADKLAKAIRAHFTAFDLIEGEGEVALALRWHGAPSYERIAAFADGIRRGLATTIERKKPIYLMLDGDIAQTLGAILREELLVESEILAIDGVVLRDFDYIDLGRIRMPSFTVPVTIKSLVFSEDPRRGRPHQRIHHHDHGHDHAHDHGHHHDHHHDHGIITTVTGMTIIMTRITGTAITIMTTATRTSMIDVSSGMVRCPRRDIGVLPPPLAGEWWAWGRRCVRESACRLPIPPHLRGGDAARAFALSRVRSDAVTDAVGRVALPAAAPGFDSKWVLIGVPVALVVWLALVPLVFLLWQSFLTPQSAAAPAQFTLENFRTAYLNGDNARLFFNSLQFAVGAAVLSLVVGTSARLDERAHQHAVQDAVLRARRSSRW